LSIIRLANYSVTTSLIQTDIIGDAWGFSSKASITPSRGFSIETLTGVIPSWKTKSNSSISTMEDVIRQKCGQTLGRVRVRTKIGSSNY